MASRDNPTSVVERLAAAACLALAGIFMSMFLQPFFPPGSWIWLFLALVMIGAALYRLWLPIFFSWRRSIQVFVLIVLALLAWSASAIFPGEQHGEASPAPVDAPPHQEEEKQGGIPSQLESVASVTDLRSGREVRVPGYEGADFVSLTVTDILETLPRLTEVQQRRATLHYLEKRYVVSGRIEDLAEADAGRALLIMGPPSGVPRVFAWLAAEEFERVVNLNKGDTVTLVGRFEEVEAYSITLRDCEVIDQ